MPNNQCKKGQSKLGQHHPLRVRQFQGEGSRPLGACLSSHLFILIWNEVRFWKLQLSAQLLLIFGQWCSCSTSERKILPLKLTLIYTSDSYRATGRVVQVSISVLENSFQSMQKWATPSAAGAMHFSRCPKPLVYFHSTRRLCQHL